MKKIMNDFIPVYKLAKNRGLSRQIVYKWIRQGKVSPEDLKIVEKTVKRILIKSDFKFNSKSCWSK